MKIFIFPLGESVLHPGTSKPLHIFEPRYLKMTEDALASGTPMALSFSDGAVAGSVVGFGAVDLLERRPEGTLLIRVAGEGKARLISVDATTEPYLIAEAEPIPESYELNLEQGLSYLNLQRRLTHWMREHIIDENTRAHFLEALDGPRAVVGAANSFLVNDSDMQQLVLEASDVNEKVALLMSMLEHPETS